MKLHSLLALTLLLAGVFTIGRCQDGAEEDYMQVDDDEDYEIGDDMMGQMGGMGEEEEVEEPAPKEVRPPKYFTAPEIVEGTTNLAEVFLNAGSLGSKWIVSNAKKDDVDEELAKYDGKWAVEEPENQPLIGDLGLVLKSKAKHHAVAASLDRPFVFEDEPFIVQYEVKYQNGMECGGSYVKLLTDNKDLKLAGFHDKTPYTIMFGPDKCGNDNKLHFIFRHKNPVTGEFEEKHAKKPTGTFSQVFSDKKTHLFTLILEPDNSFEILVDQKSISSGNLLEDMTPAVNPPAEIDDPNETKPADWDDKKKIADPEAEKPEDWDEDAPAKIDDPDAEKPDDWLDNEPELIDDPDAEKPEDWDDDMDGEWEPPKIKNPKCDDVGCGEWEVPTISNPDYKGKWKAAMIDNPNYKGEWKPQRIANPGFFEDLEPFRMTTIAAVGLELWSMTEQILFDNFLITNSREVADKFAADTWALKTEEEGYVASADSVVGSLLGATDERPWLWAIYALVILIPIFLCFRFCFPRGSSSDEEHPKKTDAPSADDEDKKEGEEEEGEEEAAGNEEAGAEGGEEEQTVRQRGKKKTKADLEQSSAAAKAEEPSAEEEKTTASGDSPSRKSPRQRKSRKE